MSLGPVSASATGDQKNTSALLDLQLATEPIARSDTAAAAYYIPNLAQLY